jgi:hypothetical protein
MSQRSPGLHSEAKLSDVRSTLAIHEYSQRWRKSYMTCGIGTFLIWLLPELRRPVFGPVEYALEQRGPTLSCFLRPSPYSQSSKRVFLCGALTHATLADTHKNAKVGNLFPEDI